MNIESKNSEYITVQFYGIRGSFPLTSQAYRVYGGNTVCTSVTCGCHVVLDAGSGLRELGEDLTADRNPIHLLLSHLHMDHIQGLFDFQPFFESGREIHIYGENVSDALHSILTPPFWPVGFADFPADVHFHDIRPEFTFWIEDKIQVRTIRSCHPGKCLAFRMSFGGHSLGYALDYELSADTQNRLEHFLEHCDMVIMDGSYAPGNEVAGWGHSSWEQNLMLCKRAHVGKLVVSHYSSGLNDERLAQEQTIAEARSDNCIFAREGMKINF